MSIKKSKIVISLMITVSIIVFNYRPKGSKNIGASISSLLLLIPLAMEGFTNTSQDQLFALNKLYKITSNDLLFYNNFINVIVHAGYLILFDRDQVTSFMNDKIVWSGSYQIAIQLFLYAALQIIGTNLIFKVLYQFDSLALLRITILRKVTSLLISCIFMSEGKQFSKYEITGLAGVIGSLLLEFYLKKNQSRGDIKKVSIVKTNFKIPDLRSKKTH